MGVLFYARLAVVCGVQRLYFLRKGPPGKVAGKWGFTIDFSLHGELMLQTLLKGHALCKEQICCDIFHNSLSFSS